MERLLHLLVLLGRIGRCRGFGIQSPSDYWFVRYVINEPWPYYSYEDFPDDDPWLRRKLGRLYFRLANWRQPRVISSDDYRTYFQAGCRKARFGASTELMRVALNGNDYSALWDALSQASEGTLLIVENIRRYRTAWAAVVRDPRATITFDLWYVGLVLFLPGRYKQHYIINF